MNRKVTPAPPPPVEPEEGKRERNFFLKLLLVGAAVNAGGAALLLHASRPAPRLAGAMVAPAPPAHPDVPSPAAKINVDHVDFDGEADISDDDDHATDDDDQLVDREADEQ